MLLCLLETQHNLNQILPEYPIDSKARGILCHLTTMSDKDRVEYFFFLTYLYFHVFMIVRGGSQYTWCILSITYEEEKIKYFAEYVDLN